MKKPFPWKGILAALTLLLLAAGSVTIAYFCNSEDQAPNFEESNPTSAHTASTKTESEHFVSSEITDPEHSDVTETGTETFSSATETDEDVTDSDDSNTSTKTDTQDTPSTSTVPLSEILGSITPPPDGSTKKIAFTFDDGPYTPVTRGLVDEFEKYGGNCTFFVIGNRIFGTQKESMIYAAEKGNEIAIHAYTHNANYSKCSDSVYKFEIEKTAEEIKNAIGKSPTLMRPVGGAITNSRVANSPYAVILWNVDTLDWKYRNADTVARKILTAVTEGDIILLHDIYPSTLEAVKKVLPLLQEHGYEFVTVSELLGDEMQSGKKYSNAY